MIEIAIIIIHFIYNNNNNMWLVARMTDWLLVSFPPPHSIQKGAFGVSAPLSILLADRAYLVSFV